MSKKEVFIRFYSPEEKQADTFYTIAENAFQYGAPWTLEQYERTLAERGLFFIVAELEHQVIGYIGGKIVLEESEIYTVVVQKDYQHKQIAKRLLQAFKEECEKHNVNEIFLEVRVSNTVARQFYERNGFEIVTVRKYYYSSPKEDALIMKYTVRK